MGLSPAIGQQQAHDLVYDACRTVNEQGGTLAEALAAMPPITQHVKRATIDSLTDPINHPGLLSEMVNRALATFIGWTCPSSPHGGSLRQTPSGLPALPDSRAAQRGRMKGAPLSAES